MKHRLTASKTLAIGFAAVILICAILLCLPISSRSGQWTDPLSALFTATSSTCVTGLVVFDTYTYWSLFGQIVILCFIQIGGLGFMTLISLLLLFARRKINLHERRLIMQSAGSLKLNGVISLLKRIVIWTAAAELAGTIILATRFCPRMGLGEGLYNALFHSVSAFCNAGFDLMGKYSQFGSFTGYTDDPVVCLTLIALIIFGGLGFLVWDDIFKNGIHVRRFELHTKIVLTMTGILIISGWLLFYIFEYNGAFASMTIPEKILASLFQSVTPRTAGFNTVDQSALSESGSILTSILMFIGGSPGSTAGGIKTTTFAVIFLNMISSARHTGSVSVCRKRLDNETVRQATAVFTVYLGLVLAAAMIILAVEPALGVKNILFETVSAIGTVGLSAGITPSLSAISRVVIILLMYSGRIGAMTLMLALSEKRFRGETERPIAKILIG